MPIATVRLLALLLGMAVATAGCVTSVGPGPMASATAVPDPRATPLPADPDSVTSDAVSAMNTLAGSLGAAGVQEREMVGNAALFTTPAPTPSPSSSDGEAYPRISETRQVADNSDGTRTVTVVRTEDGGLWRRTGTAVLTVTTPDRPVRFAYTSDSGAEYGGSTFTRTKAWNPDGQLREATIAYNGSQGDPQSGPGAHKTTMETKALTLSATEETYTGTVFHAGRILSLALALQPTGGTITLADRLTDVTVRNTFNAQGRLSPTLQVFVHGRTYAKPLP